MKGLINPKVYKDKYVEHYHPVFNELRKRNVRPLISAKIIDEHRANPLGLRPNFHSIELQFVLAYFRTISEHAFYLPIELPGGKGFGIVAAARGKEPKVLADTVYQTVDEARHAIFLKRVEELELNSEVEREDV
ncbi:hypothetical protein [Sinorhizobium meliloti]|uniref:hypothetical protein n=1 Tax=Rhizobium meliloti TaxID=382 RepID=UPI000381ED66|nr:hypothetical protein [Sinorhizobium meliloti]